MRLRVDKLNAVFCRKTLKVDDDVASLRKLQEKERDEGIEEEIGT